MSEVYDETLVDRVDDAVKDWRRTFCDVEDCKRK